MESRGLGNRTIARAAVLAIVSTVVALLIIAGENRPVAVRAEPLRQAPPGCRVICSTCVPVTFECRVAVPPGGIPGDRDPTPAPPGTTPLPPAPTATPPPGAGPGHYVTACIVAGPDALCSCNRPGMGCRITLWQSNNGEIVIIATHCVDSCSGPTPAPTPIVDPYPCRREPSFSNGSVSQPCENGPDEWPGWDLSVSVKIPPVDAARNPWPRSLVGFETTFCFVSAPDGVEQYSANSARECRVDRSEHDSPNYECETTAGVVGAGDRVNLKLGVAWRRYTGANPGFGGASLPAYPSVLALEDRDFNGGSTVVPIGPGQCTNKTYQTSSWGLEETFPKWKPECQERECDYVERVQNWTYTGEACDNPVCTNCASAYDSPIQTWWWPEWTWRYDEYQCARQEWSECFYDTRQLVGGKFAGCGQGPHAGEADWWQERQCTAWGWRDVIEPWRKYDMRQQGLPSAFWRSTRTSFAGMDENHHVRTPFVYPPSVPVIEAQPVAP